VLLSVNLRFGLSFENGYLLVTIVRVQRNLSAGGKRVSPVVICFAPIALVTRGMVCMPLPRSTTGNESILKMCASGMAKSALEKDGLCGKSKSGFDDASS
jgi:hypothetical protein